MAVVFCRRSTWAPRLHTGGVGVGHADHSVIDAAVRASFPRYTGSLPLRLALPMPRDVACHQRSQARVRRAPGVEVRQPLPRRAAVPRHKHRLVCPIPRPCIGCRQQERWRVTGTNHRAGARTACVGSAAVEGRRQWRSPSIAAVMRPAPEPRTHRGSARCTRARYGAHGEHKRSIRRLCYLALIATCYGGARRTPRESAIVR